MDNNTNETFGLIILKTRIINSIYSYIRNICFIFADDNISFIMRIVSHKTLKDFYEQTGHEDAKVPLEHWYHRAENANWKNFAEMKADFGSVDNVGNQHYVFNIGGNKYRLFVVVKFVMGYAFIRFVGTHKEYDKIDASTI